MMMASACRSTSTASPARWAAGALASPRKGLRWAGISLLLAVALFVLALALYALGKNAPGLADLSPLMWLLGFVAAVFAAVPAAWPYIWNRKQ